VNNAYGRLHRGELEVIIGAKESKVDIVIIDEKSARNFAETLLLKPLGTFGILKLAKQRGIIDNIKPYIDTLVKSNYRISKKLYLEILNESGEN